MCLGHLMVRKLNFLIGQALLELPNYIYISFITCLLWNKGKEANLPKNCVKIRVKKLKLRETLYAIAGGRGFTTVSMLKTR